MIHTQQAQMQLDELKHSIIGLFKMRNSKQFEMLIEVNDNDTIDVVRFTQFGIIQEEFNLPTHYGTYKVFPDNKNMSEMLDNPFEWNEFVESFN